MIIHVVEQGETIYTIAYNYKVNPERLIKENNLMDPNQLVVGQPIVIVYPEQMHTVEQGDTLSKIADMYNVTTLDILRNNPFVLDREYLYPGEILVIRYADEKDKSIRINGYAYPFIDRKVLEKNLFYLTYLSIFNYTVSEDGKLNDIDDIELINMAKNYGVAPIMVVSNVTKEGTVNKEIVHKFLSNEDSVKNLIENILLVAKEKGYYGVNLDIPDFLPEDRQNYIDAVTNVIGRLKSEDIKVYITIYPNAFGPEGIISSSEMDFTRIMQLLDGVVLISYSWGYISEIPFNAIPFDYQLILLEYIETQIPPEKIAVGLTTIGYILRLPYSEGVSRAEVISNENAIQLARDTGAVINFNENNLSSNFFINKEDYFVYFHDVRGLNPHLEVVTQHNLSGIALWNIMYFLAQEFLLINTQYQIDHVI